MGGSASILCRLRLARRKFTSTSRSMISAEDQPSAFNFFASSPVFAAPEAASSTTSLPSAAFCDSAQIRPRRRTFLFNRYPCERTTGPCTTPPPRNCGARRLPWRALPVPFCRYGFLVVPETSLRPLALCVPARRFANCQCTTRAMMSARGFTAKNSPGRSTPPAEPLSPVEPWSSVVISICIVVSSGPRLEQHGGVSRVLGRHFHGVAHMHPAAARAGHRASDHDQALFRVDRGHDQVERGDALDTEMAGHFLVLERLAGVLPVAGRAKRSMTDRNAVAGFEAGEVPALHAAGETFALGQAAHVDALA